MGQTELNFFLKMEEIEYSEVLCSLKQLLPVLGSETETWTTTHCATTRKLCVHIFSKSGSVLLLTRMSLKAFIGAPEKS